MQGCTNTCESKFQVSSLTVISTVSLFQLHLPSNSHLITKRHNLQVNWQHYLFLLCVCVAWNIKESPHLVPFELFGHNSGGCGQSLGC